MQKYFLSSLIEKYHGRATITLIYNYNIKEEINMVFLKYKYVLYDQLNCVND